MIRGAITTVNGSVPLSAAQCENELPAGVSAKAEASSLIDCVFPTPFVNLAPPENPTVSMPADCGPWVPTGIPEQSVVP
jgi:hypothetical protein